MADNVNENQQTRMSRSKTRDVAKTVNIAVSSRALFKLEEEHKVWVNDGPQAYIEIQQSRENNMLEKGTAYPFIKVLEYVNDKLLEIDPKEEELFDVTLMSHNHAGTGIRLIKSIQHNDLDITRMGLTDGQSPVNYLEAFRINLFLTAYANEVTDALKEGFAAATIVEQPVDQPVSDQLRIAFDLDAVLFSDESELIFQEKGLKAYLDHEQKLREIPLKEGPLKKFAQAIGRMQEKFRINKDKLNCKPPIRTYFVTARSVAAGERALRTLRSWDLEVNETFLMGGASKSGILKAIKPHIFFDDSRRNIDGARSEGIAAGHVK